MNVNQNYHRVLPISKLVLCGERLCLEESRKTWWESDVQRWVSAAEALSKEPVFAQDSLYNTSDKVSLERCLKPLPGLISLGSYHFDDFWVNYEDLISPYALDLGYFPKIDNILSEWKSIEDPQPWTYFSNRVRYSKFRWLIQLSLLPVVYGGIHLTTWRFRFPSNVESLLWRIAALSIIFCLPIVFLYIHPVSPFRALGFGLTGILPCKGAGQAHSTSETTENTSKVAQ